MGLDPPTLAGIKYLVRIRPRPRHNVMYDERTGGPRSRMGYGIRTQEERWGVTHRGRHNCSSHHDDSGRDGENPKGFLIPERNERKRKTHSDPPKIGIGLNTMINMNERVPGGMTSDRMTDAPHKRPRKIKLMNDEIRHRMTQNVQNIKNQKLMRIIIQGWVVSLNLT